MNTVLVLGIGTHVTISRNLKPFNEAEEHKHSFYIASDMCKLAGKKGHITKAIVDRDGIYYLLDIDGGKWYWNAECFEVIY